MVETDCAMSGYGMEAEPVPRVLAAPGFVVNATVTTPVVVFTEVMVAFETL